MIARRLSDRLFTLLIFLALLSFGGNPAAAQDSEAKPPAVVFLRSDVSRDDAIAELTRWNDAWDDARFVSVLEPPADAAAAAAFEPDQVIKALDMLDQAQVHLVARGIAGIRAFEVAIAHPTRVRSVSIIGGVDALGLERPGVPRLADDALRSLTVPSALFVGEDDRATGTIATWFVGRAARSRVVSVSSPTPNLAFGDDAVRTALMSFIDEVDHFEVIFDGTSLDGWTGDERFWSVQDGAIVGRTTPDNPAPHNTFLILDGDPVGDFELRVEVMMTGNNNSGIQYRARVVDGFRVHGYQCDIHPNPPYCGMLYEEGGRGIVCQQGQRIRIRADGGRAQTADAVTPRPFDLSEWNEFTIIARGNRLEHRINGHVTAVIEDLEDGKRSERGVIALQIHAGAPYEVRFRNIRLHRGLPTN